MPCTIIIIFYPRGAECPNTVGRPESLLRHVAGFGGGGGGEATTARQAGQASCEATEAPSAGAKLRRNS